MTTTIDRMDIRELLNLGNLAVLDKAFKKIKLGNMLTKVSVTVAGATAAAAFDITTAAFKAAATTTIAGITLKTGENLPPIGHVESLRVSASGTATSVGSYIAGDASATAAIPPGGASSGAGVATLSATGTTITFPNTVTGFVLEYFPAPAVAMTTSLELGAPAG